MQDIQTSSTSLVIEVLYGVLYSFLGVVFGYLFYTRVIDYYLSKMHYAKYPICKEVLGLWGSYPFIGNLFAILYTLWYKEKYDCPRHPVDVFVREFYEEPPKVVVAYYSAGTSLLISDPKIVEAMYTSKNSFFSKHPLVKDLQECLIGDSILFAETSLEWKEARKKISPAFYKGKLVSLIELAR